MVTFIPGFNYHYTCIVVCTVHVRVHRMPYAVSVCANTFTRSVDAKYCTSVRNISEGNARKMENTNTQIRELYLR